MDHMGDRCYGNGLVGFDVRVHHLGCIIMQIQMKRVWELRHLEKGSQRNKNAL